MENKPLILELESLFSALSDYTRLEIVLLLLEREASVQEISLSLNKSQSLISHHLACLRNCGVVEVKKRGKNSIYSVTNDVKAILDQAISHVSKHSKQILACDIVKEDIKEREERDLMRSL
ncbi:MULTISPECIES: ArsR/SmtB family transcription factor [Metallosphaera]|uniref:ArsR family transcriptional regulator n=1 Tax=Metallosphaera cuprina (strain Ar-4) TaxID=1006006 RepID=F4G373_METCR|nr:metalloregulator ArsR/SmtB family transcription factor [Metallosphaera cuprina]AEB95271.1 ArsR family transcriptional regulator [Metallosphaera cuprina Ar-4]